MTHVYCGYIMMNLDNYISHAIQTHIRKVVTHDLARRLRG
jgi:hypothetical protein